METVAALALSCNIIELVVLAGKSCVLIKQVWDCKTLPAHEEFTSAILLLEQNVEALDAFLTDAQNPSYIALPRDKEILLLAKNCRRLGVELRQKIDALRARKTDTRGEKFEKTLQTLFGKGKVYDLQRRLDELRKAVDTALLVRTNQLLHVSTLQTNSSLREISDKLAHALADFAAESRATDSGLRQHITVETTTSHVKLADLLTEQNSRLRLDNAIEGDLSRQLTIRQGRLTRRDAAKHNNSAERCVKLELQKTRSFFLKHSQWTRHREIENEQRLGFISSLRFPEMNARRNQIVDPHSQTFEWIFNESIEGPWDSFRQFLQTPSSIYWINGKAGSGKSSLMRFICSHGKCQQILDMWSKPKKTLTISWYFWNSGTEFQRSLKGALCSLIHQVLSHDHDLASKLYHTHMLNVTVFRKENATDWSVGELVSLFESALELAQTHVIIFLDGLDEFDHNQDITCLLVLLQKVTQQSHIKACVSSRPEKHLEYHLDAYPQLRLQDLTGNDIKTFVIERLQSCTCGMGRPEIQDLAERTRDRASGVFLWVRLVTDQLVRGLHHGDTREILLERLAKLPPKMEALYEHMWRSLNGDDNLETYRQQAARCLAFHQVFPLTVFELVVALDDGIQHAFIDTVSQSSELKPILQKCVEMEDMLKTRCAGLLEISHAPDSQSVDLGSLISGKSCHSAGSSCRISDQTSDGLVYVSKGTLNKNVSALIEQSTDHKILAQYLVEIGALEINFIHRSARDFLVDSINGRKALQHCTWNIMDIATRLVNAYLQRKILGLSARFNADGRSNSKYITLDRLVSFIFSIEDPQPAIVDRQHSLLERINSVYRTVVDSERTVALSEWHENWYFFSSEQNGTYHLDYWGSIASYFSNSLCNLVLPSDSRNAVTTTYFLSSVCWAPDPDIICSRNLQAIRVFLSHQADPNSTCMYTHRDYGQCSPWLRFLRLASRAPSYSGIEDQLVSTIESFRKSGAELSSVTHVAYHPTSGESDCFDALMGSTFHELGEVIFEVNAAHFLGRIYSKIQDPALACRIQQMLERTTPHQHAALVRGGNGRWFKVNPEESVDFVEQVLKRDQAEAVAQDFALYARKATIQGTIVKPRSFLATRRSAAAYDRAKRFGGLEHLREASARLRAGLTTSWLTSTWATIGITSELVNGFSEITHSRNGATRFILVEDMINHLSSFLELHGPLYLCAPAMDELYSGLLDIWEELVEVGKEEAAKLEGRRLEEYNEELEELFHLLNKHGLEHALASRGIST
ncbi:hypothetical protein LTR84_009407 [Exophiala bonariae]|uniref:NACHT domain-containing protein n=1 Tax=Exophiala bonariae TaxID=1690606 RepID=A0AAV9MUK8_9EURO|nr:hypothetical protein LTR84_009407 [Exophiala bonariae]